ncbi:hypothetical protein CMI42_05880 [Candidatus Pacearchaeota archaeon]|nr:hypothetical protein [Candidatus Pacearchaeota archaeon]|tara:strand:- start:74 stop:1246 length:1173 start_codon:yes stop_codon:yes gene_type:complete
MISEYIPAIAGYNPNVKALIVFIVLFLVLKLILYFAQKLFISLTSKTKTDLDDLILSKSTGPVNFLALVISLILSLKEITFTENVEFILFKFLYSLLAISIGYLIFVIVDLSLVRVWKKISEKTESDVDDTIGQLVHEMLRIILIVAILISILNIWGINIGPLLAGLGIAGLAVALALQPMLSNIFSGIAIIIDGTFKVGDVIELNDGKMGEVYNIGLRTTRIKSFDNEMIIIPNSELATSPIKNFFQPDISIRVNLEFGVEYGVDPEYVKKLAIEEIEKLSMINRDEEVRVIFTEMGDNSLNFKALFWVDDMAKKWPAHQEAMSRIYRRLYKEDIGIPYPQRTIWMRDESKVKSPNPTDDKFKSVKDKYFSAFGHEYKEEDKDKEGKKK